MQLTYELLQSLMCQCENQDGYYSTKLSLYGKSKTVRVHRLVAQAFIPNDNNYPEVNHIDCNRKNNNVNNLEWCTHIQNISYSAKIGHYVMKCGSDNPNYGNKKLSTFYKIHPEIAIKNQSRPMGQNGKARKVALYDQNNTYIDSFECMKACGQYLLDNKYIRANAISSIARISKAMKYNLMYGKHYFREIIQ